MIKQYLLHKQIIEPYDLPLFLFVGPKDEFDKWLKKKFDERAEVSPNADAFTCYGCQEQHITVWLSTEDKYGLRTVSLLAHEAVHVTWILQKIKGDIFNEGSQESQCYLLQRLFQNWLFFLADHTKEGKYNLKSGNKTRNHKKTVSKK